MKYILLFMLAISFNVYSNEQVSKRAISGISTYDSYAVINLSQDHENLENCTKETAKSAVILPLNSDGASFMFSTILSAKAAGAKVGFGLTGSYSHGDGTVPKIYRVDY